jgi:hypothetical protein
MCVCPLSRLARVAHAYSNIGKTIKQCDKKIIYLSVPSVYGTADVYRWGAEAREIAFAQCIALMRNPWIPRD